MTTWRISLLMAFALWTWPTLAQAQAIVSPNPSLSGQPLRLSAGLPVMSCFHDFTSQTVERTARGVRVRYTVETVLTALCFTVMPPLYLQLPIGSFAAGQYEAEVSGTIDGVPSAPQTVTFVVSGGHAVTAATIVPAVSTWGLTLIALCLGGIAARVLARRA